MFSQASAILFTRGGVGGDVADTPHWADAPPWQTHPWADTPMGRHPPGRCPLDRHPPGQTPPHGQTPPGHPPEMVAAADGTHPTGMDSC